MVKTLINMDIENDRGLIECQGKPLTVFSVLSC